MPLLRASLLRSEPAGSQGSGSRAGPLGGARDLRRRNGEGGGDLAVHDPVPRPGDGGERAFPFWSYLAAYSEDSEIKTAAEAMAKEELGHVAILRKERRRAYHREHDRKQADVAGRRSRSMRKRSSFASRPTSGLSSGAWTGRRRCARESCAMTMADEVGDFGRLPGVLEQRDAEVIAEALAEAYLEGAERSADAERVQSLQALAERAISRLA